MKKSKHSDLKKSSNSILAFKAKVKNRLYEIIEVRRPKDKTSAIFNNFITFLIIINVIAIILESFNEIYVPYFKWFYLLEVFTVIVFTFEYVSRLWVSHLKYPELKRYKSIWKQMTSPMTIIDLLAILPFYLPAIFPIGFMTLRILRLSRLLRIFKLPRYSKALQIVLRVLKREKEELGVTIFMTSVLLILASTLMYYAEHTVQPEEFPNIFATLWWAVSTITTVGYGDVYPLTPIGKLLSAVVALLGIGLVALPTGILASGFMEEFEEKKENNIKYCPHCGKKLE